MSVPDEVLAEPTVEALEAQRECLTPLAEALCAAAVATAMGNRSIDYTRRAYVEATGEPVGAGWLLLAWHANRVLAR